MQQKQLKNDQEFKLYFASADLLIPQAVPVIAVWSSNPFTHWEQRDFIVCPSRCFLLQEVKTENKSNSSFTKEFGRKNPPWLGTDCKEVRLILSSLNNNMQLSVPVMQNASCTTQTDAFGQSYSSS